MVTHFAFDFGAGYERRYRVDDHDVDGARPQKYVCDFERLLTGVGLRHEQVFNLNPKTAGIVDVERMFGVDEGGDAAGLLNFSNGMKRQRRLTTRLRAVDLDYATAGIPADPEGNIDTRRATREVRDLMIDGIVGHRDDRTFPELLFDR